MKLICRQCKETNKHTAWRIVQDKGFLCEHCWFYMERSKLSNFAQTCLHFVYIIGFAIVFNSPYIEGILFSITPSKLIQFLLSMAVVVVVVFFILVPIEAFVMCLVTNRITLTKYKNGIEGKPPKK